MKFNQYYNYVMENITEAFDTKEYNLVPAGTPISLIIGRFNPWTKGHNALIKDARYPVVIGLVKSLKTSQDKNKNPFDFQLQKEIINRSNNPKIIDIVTISSANIPQIISILRDKGYEAKELWAGTDRVLAYKRQIESYLSRINSDLKLKILKRKEDDPDIAGISATKLRKAIKNSDYQSANNMMIGLDKDLFDRMYKIMMSH